MENDTIRRRLKLTAAILCALLSPIAGMLVAGFVFWAEDLTIGTGVGGLIGLALHFGIAHEELELRRHWKGLAASFFSAFVVFEVQLMRGYSQEMAILIVIYLPLFVSLLPLIGALDKEGATQRKRGSKPMEKSSTRGIVALALWVVVFFIVGWLVPRWRPMIWGYLSVAIILGAFLRIVFLLNRYAFNSAYPSAVRAYHEQCDPRPLLAVCERRLSKATKDSVRSRWLMQKAAALIDLGEAEQGERILQSLLLPEQNLPVEGCATCYFNLSAIALLLGHEEEAVKYHEKCAACVPRIKAEKTRQILRNSLREQEGSILYCAGDFNGAKQVFVELGWDAEPAESEGAPQTLSIRVFHAYKLGMALLKTGEAESARERLAFAATHGNQLYIAVLANSALCEALES